MVSKFTISTCDTLGWNDIHSRCCFTSRYQTCSTRKWLPNQYHQWSYGERTWTSLATGFIDIRFVEISIVNKHSHRLCLETRQVNRRHYESYVCRRIIGKQAVVVLGCDNRHMDQLMSKWRRVLCFGKVFVWVCFSCRTGYCHDICTWCGIEVKMKIFISIRDY